ncbi:hypothetical protein RhiirA1_478521 [Rhizophagus irregularis]|uniref:Uncharacterized protein n=1 Tax=Rhizophagus irregularis TaxID=588596 RepID=A0A2N0QRY4_9GLOM|nr:hypothetical protein RhiirA1_478521 [Rhizophagus irregularis]
MIWKTAAGVITVSNYSRKIKPGNFTWISHRGDWILRFISNGNKNEFGKLGKVGQVHEKISALDFEVMIRTGSHISDFGILQWIFGRVRLL